MKLFVDLTQKKLPIMLIIVLIGILIFQYTSEPNVSKLIDSDTCELYIEDNQINGKKYLGEYDSKCLEAKNTAP